MGFLDLRRPGSGKFAERLVERATQHVGTERAGAVGRPFQLIERERALGRRCGDGALAGRQHRHRTGGEAGVLEGSTETAVMAHLALEQWDLDPIIAGCLEAIEQRHMLVDDVGRPQQEVETELHCNALRFRSWGAWRE
jgi:hypothetical protein